MYKCGLVVLTKGLTERNLQEIYKYSKSCIGNRLYIRLNDESSGFNGDWKYNIKTCYNIATKICPHLDVRLILPHATGQVTERHISVVLCDDIGMKLENLRPIIALETIQLPQVLLNIDGCEECNFETQKYDEKKFSHVCLGGAFDRIHNGHKILLSISAFMSKEKVFCGVSSDELLKNKCLCELVEPLPIRIDNCRSFLKDIKPDISYTVASISHPFGPTTSDSSFDCIVGSVETKLGCEKINEVRKNIGFSPLHIELIDMINDESSDNNQIVLDSKISSTKGRLNLLGNLLKPINTIYKPGKPYVIGLTGGIASGKSSIVKHLQSFGAEVIDCDKLGHEAYIPGSDCFNKIITTFGKNIINNDTGMINRAALGAIVFQNPLEMKKLTDIVWPAISNLAETRIREIDKSIKNDNKCIIIIDAAVLLDAGWEHLCNEIWVSFVPKDEAIVRLKNRNNLNENDATLRINSQKPNKFYIEAAHVVFCTLWSYEFTHSQIEKAWNGLHKRLNAFGNV